MMSALTSFFVVIYAFPGWEMEAGMKTMFLRRLALLVLAAVHGFTLFSLSYERADLANYAANPRYPQEMLTSVPDSLWNKLLHERND
jgi:hypothetical protein